jgi:hypothetical protein
MVTGEECKFEFSSADATTAAAIVIYDLNGTVRVLGSNERFLPVNILGVAATAAGLIKIFNDVDANGAVGAGELIAVFSGQINYPATDELWGRLGNTPKVKAAAAGQIDITGTGKIIRS